MLKLINRLIPFIENSSYNKKISKKINDLLKSEGQLVYMDGYSNIEIDVLKDFYNDTFEIKNKLEDKAKLNIIGLTISISLIFSFSSLITKINENIGFLWIKIVILIVSVSALLYMLSAGMLSMAVLIKHNTVYKMRICDFAGNEKTIKKAYALNTELNINKNIIRNNYVYTSYESILNSFICLVFIFLISILIVNF
jgi:hypothetical protein